MEAALADAGFDLVHAFDAHALSREPDLAWLCGAEPRGLLIGNTRALWPVFVRAMADPALATLPDPLERYTERVLAAAFPGARIYYAHRQYAGAFLPLQRVADAAGLGSLAANHLVIHPIHGPWFALRAVVVTHGPAIARAPIAKPCGCTGACEAALEVALAGGDWRAWLAVRDACSLRASRYSEDQIRYHYLKVWPVPPTLE